MPKIETRTMKIGEEFVDIEIQYSVKSQVFHAKNFPGNVLSAIDYKGDLAAPTHKELLELLQVIIDKYVPLVSTKEKVIVVYANVGSRTRKALEEACGIRGITDVKDHIRKSNEHYYKYGFLSYDRHGRHSGIESGVSFEYQYAYRIKVSDKHYYVYAGDFYDPNDLGGRMDLDEDRCMVLEYTPETDQFVQDFRQALEKLSWKLVEFFKELREQPEKCITERKKFLELGE